jgi:predicted RNase H-like HicB family nuclease
MRYLIVIERTATGVSAYSPDLPSCVATGATREEGEREMKDAIVFHLEGRRSDGADIPEPNTYSTYVDVPV